MNGGIGGDGGRGARAYTKLDTPRTKDTMQTYNTTWEQCRDEVARRIAEPLPATVTKEWMAQIYNALANNVRLSPHVLRGLAKLYDRSDIVEMVGGSFPGYDWSYAQPVLDELKAAAK